MFSNCNTELTQKAVDFHLQQVGEDSLREAGCNSLPDCTWERDSDTHRMSGLSNTSGKRQTSLGSV